MSPSSCANLGPSYRIAQDSRGTDQGLVRDLNHHTKEHTAISFLYLRYGEFLRSTRYSKLLPIHVADGISGLLKFTTLIRARYLGYSKILCLKHSQTFGEFTPSHQLASIIKSSIETREPSAQYRLQPQEALDLQVILREYQQMHQVDLRRDSDVEYTFKVLYMT